MGTFGSPHYSLSFFIDFHPQLPASNDGIRPEAISLVDAWKGLGLTYFLLKGLKKTSKTFKLMNGSDEGNSKKYNPGANTGDRISSRCLTLKNPGSARPPPRKCNADYGLGKISRNKGKVTNHTKACKSDAVGVHREQLSTLADAVEEFSESGLREATTRSAAELKFLTGKSIRGIGLGVEGVMTTITGLSQQVQYKNEMKEIITVVKTADRVLQGVKAANGVLQTFSSPLDNLLALGAGGNGVILGMNTVKIVLKGVKISKGLTTVTKLCNNKQTGAIGVGAEMVIKADQNILGQRFKVIMKGLKASEGAANVVSISKEVGKTLGMLDKAELLSWNLIMKGFKFTKSAIRALEPVGCFHWGMMSALGKGILEMKAAVEGVGVVVKAVVLSQELYMVILKGVGFTKGAMTAFNECKRRSLLGKRFSKQPPEVSNSGSEEGYSQRSEVSFKSLRCGQLAMSSVNWSSIEPQRKYFMSNDLELLGHFCCAKDVSLYMTPESLQDADGTHFLLPTILTLASCFDLEP
ncbi:uncharacterized protein [Physcomitrium patens]|uniref:Uncharacterized protein n=1 Tax=Physcomitrium patens TaxID=3218 RepID=A0A2K1IQ92_PHYPA|nr:uncharacterized protein LOC112274081 [Physcomitrium patens]PNR31451.1 hypothetical protein PHYPA_025572 [Physcomitrium patens]|eukprot:XP_024359010.1 uncharacterized protein LOC112274081 [Physcomitrella patens]